MTFSVSEGRIGKLAGELAGSPLSALELCTGGGNNRVYRVETADGTFALKSYLADDRDRIGHEFDGLAFLGRNGAGRLVPRALAVNRKAGIALYEWISGRPAHEREAGDLEALLSLLELTHKAARAPGAHKMPVATEAWLSAADLVAQIESRLGRLRKLENEPALAAFLDGFDEEWHRRRRALGTRESEKPLDPALRTLSPSDTGFHNAIRGADGRLTFVDFEYFGWDDPVKTAADILWHPAFTLSAPERVHFLRAITELYTMDPDFPARLAAYFPLAGLRWTLIVLNEFVPAVWARRAFAGAHRDRSAAKASQLAKAAAYLQSVRAYSGTPE